MKHDEALERFKLNPAAKEHRLQKMRRRLVAATPKEKRFTRTPAPAPRKSGSGWIAVLLIALAILTVVYQIGKKAGRIEGKTQQTRPIRG